MDATTGQRLAAARRRALAPLTAHPSHSVLTWAHRNIRLGAAGAALLLLLAGWWIFQPSAPPYSPETDILLLTGELPPAAYADNTFSQWLEAHATF
jgi:hypothetical protein